MASRAHIHTLIYYTHISLSHTRRSIKVQFSSLIITHTSATCGWYSRRPPPPPSLKQPPSPPYITDTFVRHPSHILHLSTTSNNARVGFVRSVHIKSTVQSIFSMVYIYVCTSYRYVPNIHQCKRRRR